MPALTVNFEVFPHYVLAEAQGQPTAENAAEFFSMLSEFCERRAIRRAVIDLRRITGTPAFSTQYVIGCIAADRLRNLDRFASVVRAADRTHASAKAAQSKGLQLQVFVEVESAVRWVEG